jgi:DNA-binding phage protein
MFKTPEFDPANYLDAEVVIAEYLRLAQLSGDGNLLISAQSDVARAKHLFNLDQFPKRHISE